MDWTREEESGVSGTDVEQPHVSESVCLPPTPRHPVLLLNDIRLLADRKWDAAGRPTENSFRFWLEAEQELRQHKQTFENSSKGVEPQ